MPEEDLNLSNILNNLTMFSSGSGSTPATGASGFNFGGMFGENGWAALNTISGLGNLYMGLRNFGMQKDQFRQNSQLMRTNLANQAKLTNAALNDRQIARNAINPGIHEDAASYMSKWGVSGKLGG